MARVDGVHEMQRVLRETLGLVERSEHAGWPDEEPAECAQILREMVSCLDDAAVGVCPRYAAIQFLPTGPVQEIAMANGWHDDYMRLAKLYDELQGRWRFFS